MDRKHGEVEVALAPDWTLRSMRNDYSVIEQLQPSILKPEDGYKRCGMVSSVALGPERDNERKQSFPATLFASPASLYKGKDFCAGFIVHLMSCSETKTLPYNLITKITYLCEWTRPAHLIPHLPSQIYKSRRLLTRTLQ